MIGHFGVFYVDFVLHPIYSTLLGHIHTVQVHDEKKTASSSEKYAHFHFIGMDTFTPSSILAVIVVADIFQRSELLMKLVG